MIDLAGLSPDDLLTWVSRLPYIIVQVLGGVVGAAVLYFIASGKAGFDVSAGFASNGYGAHSRKSRGSDMREDQSTKQDRAHDYPLVDRRSGEDRRKANDPDFFARGGMERRSGMEARQNRKKVARSEEETM